MAYETANRGAIWKNDNKEKDTQPDFKGNLDVGGVEYFVSAWKRKPDANPKAPALSFSIQRKDEQQRTGLGSPADSGGISTRQQPASQSNNDPFHGGGNDDDLPF